MKFKIVLNLFSLIIAIIVGGALYSQIDFQNFRVENPILAIIYFVVFIFCIGTMIKKSKKSKNEPSR